MRAVRVRWRLGLDEYRPEATGVIHRVGEKQWTAVGPGLCKLGAYESEEKAQAAVTECMQRGNGGSR